jgi:hypothetical protein
MCGLLQNDLQLQSEFENFSFPFGSTNIERTLLNTSETVHTLLALLNYRIVTRVVAGWDVTA